MSIRPLASGDMESLAAFFADLARHGDQRFFHPHPFSREQAAQICNACGRDRYFAMFQDHKVLGYGYLRGLDEGFEAPALGLAVSPRHRGRGIGRLMLRFLHTAARLAGLRRIVLKVYPDNTAALTLYESLGYRFTPTGDEQLFGQIDLD